VLQYPERAIRCCVMVARYRVGVTRA
jgi:hypothetical protein